MPVADVKGSSFVRDLMADVRTKNPGETEFHQAVQEVLESLSIVLDRHPEYREHNILERIIEPEWKSPQRVAGQHRILDPDRDFYLLACSDGNAVDDDPAVIQDKDFDFVLFHDALANRGYLGILSKERGRNG